MDDKPFVQKPSRVHKNVSMMSFELQFPQPISQPSLSNLARDPAPYVRPFTSGLQKWNFKTPSSISAHSSEGWSTFTQRAISYQTKTH